jgi:hypothetical protein
MKRTVKLPAIDGTELGYKSGRFPVEVEIELTGAVRDQTTGNVDHSQTRVAITAAVWKPNRSDIIQGGQMYESLLEQYPGNSSVARLVELWRRWHLNDMRAGCEHQRADWDTAAEITLYRWQRDYQNEAFRAAMKVESEAHKALKAGETVTLPADVAELLARPFRMTTTEDVAPDGYEAVKDGYPGHVETKGAGWVRPEEDPRGLLAKPCEVCGYKYGTEWRREEVPADVVAELTNWTFRPEPVPAA